MITLYLNYVTFTKHIVVFKIGIDNSRMVSTNVGEVVLKERGRIELHKKNKEVK